MANNFAPSLEWVDHWTLRATILREFARGNSRKAVIRRIRRAARQMHLRAYLYGYDTVMVRIASNKDARRAESLQLFLQGKSLARTARNNYARETTTEGIIVPCPRCWNM